jgi:hypothetical protein
MGVIVSSRVTRSGSRLSGNTAHIVVVRTEPGFDAGRGRAGTGTVEGQVC